VSAVHNSAAVIGMTREAGADEDDFHAFKRTTTELERIERSKERERKDLGVKKGALSGTVVKSGKVPSTKMVVVFK
jgi:zinc finger CCHC domain-containing protein 9